MENINKIDTEKTNTKTDNLDLMSTMEILQIMNEEDLNVIAAIKKELPKIANCIEVMKKTIQEGGRIIYIGAGTSGRLGIIDAVECGPTFSCTNEFLGLIAGGYGAIVKSVEGAEDNEKLAIEDLKKNSFNKKDMLIGIAASGRTPYVIGGIKYAKEIGAKTGCVCCNYDTEIGTMVDYPIEVSAGPEILTGSTRLKSGTCQKIIINMLSTVTMIKLGKVYKNLMVDVVASNDKLHERCRKIVMNATNCTYEIADQTLKLTNNHCKEAIVMILSNVDYDTAKEKLAKNEGFVRKAIEC